MYIGGLKMKKFIVVVGLVALMGGGLFVEQVMADTVVTHDISKLRNVTITPIWDAGETQIVDAIISGTASVIDDQGNPAGGVNKSVLYSGLPQDQKDQIRPFVLWVGKQLNIDSVGESTEPTFNP
jgi:hypothetical protein